MKKFLYRALTAFLIFSILSGTAQVLAAGSTATTAGHWAEATLMRALSDGLISGDGSSIQPDAPLTRAQMATILTRVFPTSRTADLSEISDVKKTDWFYTAASSAAALGLMTPYNGTMSLTAQVTRSQAYIVLVRAFQLQQALPDASALAKFTDSISLSWTARQAAAVLVMGGYLNGDSGKLRGNDGITLAEFLTLLYRICPNIRPTETQSVPQSGGTVLTGSQLTLSKKYPGPVYFDCATSTIALQSTALSTAVIRSDLLRAFSMRTTDVGRLVLAAGNGDVQINPDHFSSVGTLVIGDGSGTVTLGNNIASVEVTGNGRSVVLMGNVKSLLVSGSNCSVTIGTGFRADAVKILPSAVGTKVTYSGSGDTCDIYGSKTLLSGNGSVTTVNDYSGDSKLDLTITNPVNKTGYGLSGTTLQLSAPDTVKTTAPTAVTVTITGATSGAVCRGYWYVDNALQATTTVTLGASTTDTSSVTFTNDTNTPISAKLTYVLVYDDPSLGPQEVRTEKTITVEKGYRFDPAEVLSLVTTGYQGDFTYDWAIANDYDPDLKTAWVNQKGYSSPTNYLVWVNIAHERVNIFTGSEGNWKLDRTFLAGTGAPGKDTPVCVTEVLDRTYDGWVTDAYTVRPVVYFLSYAYGFHSRLYTPDGSELIDARIGFPISHGCVRMYDEDVTWMYYNIPTHTTVVIY